MKNVFHVLMTCMLFCSCAAQKNAPKIYAYRQPVLQGAKPVAVANEKQGKEVEQVIKPGVNYLIYVELPNADMQLKKIWIKKIPYSVTTEPVAKTPVLMRNTILTNQNPDTLVKATSNKVLMLKPGLAEKPAKLSGSLQKKVSGNELVLYCVMNGKDYYYTLKSIKNLPPLALQ